MSWIGLMGDSEINPLDLDLESLQAFQSFCNEFFEILSERFLLAMDNDLHIASLYLELCPKSRIRSQSIDVQATPDEDFEIGVNPWNLSRLGRKEIKR